VIFVIGDNDEEEMYVAPLADDDAKYFREAILPNLQPLSDDQYMHGLAMVLHTLARFSYVIHERDVFWCIEWQPGLIVVRFSPDKGMAWTALRSPHPEFGGREATQEEIDAYNEAEDEDDENPQYNLVFDAWDAQLDEDTRGWNGFEPVDDETRAIYQDAMAKAQELGEQLEARYSGPAYNQWAETCKANLQQWAGEGIRIR
jgi:hypothetical protein